MSKYCVEPLSVHDMSVLDKISLDVLLPVYTKAVILEGGPLNGKLVVLSVGSSVMFWKDDVYLYDYSRAFKFYDGGLTFLNVYRYDPCRHPMDVLAEALNHA